MGATSFTSNSVPFTLTNKFQLSEPNSAGVDNHTPAAQGGVSNLYIDNIGSGSRSTDLGQINSIKQLMAPGLP